MFLGNRQLRFFRGTAVERLHLLEHIGRFSAPRIDLGRLLVHQHPRSELTQFIAQANIPYALGACQPRNLHTALGVGDAN